MPIGRPLANTEVHIVDAQLAHVPVGAPGELLIGGAGLTRGYVGQAEQTAERFIRNPFSTDPEARYLHRQRTVGHLAASIAQGTRWAADRSSVSVATSSTRGTTPTPPASRRSKVFT